MVKVPLKIRPASVVDAVHVIEDIPNSKNSPPKQLGPVK